MLNEDAAAVGFSRWLLDHQEYGRRSDHLLAAEAAWFGCWKETHPEPAPASEYVTRKEVESHLKAVVEMANWLRIALSHAVRNQDEHTRTVTKSSADNAIAAIRWDKP